MARPSRPGATRTAIDVISTRGFFSALIAAAVLAGGCSQDFCNGSNSMPQTIQQKEGNCSGNCIDLLNVLFSVNCVPDVSSCETAFSKCSAQDQQALNQEIACVQGMPTCQAGGEVSWCGKLQACSPPDGEPSQACAQQLGSARTTCTFGGGSGGGSDAGASGF